MQEVVTGERGEQPDPLLRDGDVCAYRRRIPRDAQRCGEVVEAGRDQRHGAPQPSAAGTSCPPPPPTNAGLPGKNGAYRRVCPPPAAAGRVAPPAPPSSPHASSTDRGPQYPTSISCAKRTRRYLRRTSAGAASHHIHHLF